MSGHGCLWADGFPNRTEQLPSLHHQHNIGEEAGAQHQLVPLRSSCWPSAFGLSRKTSSDALFLKKINLFSRKPSCH